MSLVCPAQQKKAINSADRPNSFIDAKVHDSFDDPLLFGVIVQLSKLLLHYFLLGESFPLNHRRKLNPLEDATILNAGLPVFLSQVPLDNLMTAEMGKCRPFPLILLQHLVQQNLNILGALRDAEAKPDDFRSGQGEAIDIVLVGIRIGDLPSISVIVVLLKRGRTKPRRPGKSRRYLIGIAAETEICKFELEPVAEDNNISRFYVAVDDLL